VDVLSAQGAVVTWATSPYIRINTEGDPFLRGAPTEPARMDRLNEMIRELPGKRPGKVGIVDLAGWINSIGDKEDRRMRRDGVHFQSDTATEAMNKFLGDAIITTFKQVWAERAARKESGAPAAADINPDEIGRYLDQKYKVLVVGDRSAELAAAGISAWADRNNSALQVTTAVRPDCGLLKTQGRQDRAGARSTTPPDCASFRQSVLDAARTDNADVVLVLPSAWDLGPVKLTGATNYATWGDATFEKSAQQHFADLARQLNDLKSVVLWVNVPTGAPDQGGPGAAAKVIASADDAMAKRYDENLKAIVAAYPKGVQRVELANWAGKNLPSLLDGSDLTVDAKKAYGDWLGTQVYLQYDFNAKFK
jgi:hypothetical protein